MQHYDPIHQTRLYADMLGDDANEIQTANVISFIVNEVPPAQWQYAAEICMNIGDVYTQISMRRAECGIN
jgi:hypothetical protein